MGDEAQIADQIDIGIVAQTLAPTTECQIVDIAGTVVLESLVDPVYIWLEIGELTTLEVAQLCI